MSMSRTQVGEQEQEKFVNNAGVGTAAEEKC